MRIAVLSVVFAFSIASWAAAQRSLEELADNPPLFLETARKLAKWDEAAEPARIVGPIYFVGTKGLSVFLVTTSEGLVVLNTGMPGSGPMIETSIRKLGFKPEDIKILLAGHAHVDHAGGHAYVKKISGAKVAMIREEKDLFESGGKLDFQYGKYKEFEFEPAKVDSDFKDGDLIKLGEVEITALLTGGHTKGSTTFVMKIVDQGKTFSVVFPNGTSVNPGYRLVKNPSYPTIADDYRRTIRILEALQPDIWLHPHNETYGFDAKLARSEKEGAQAWVDPAGYKKWVMSQREKFETTVEKESKRARPMPPARDPGAPGFVAAKELADGDVPPVDANGDFIIGPTHKPAAEMAVQPSVPQGTVHELKMISTDSKLYPGIAREPNTFGTVDPATPAKLTVTTSHPAPYTRRVTVYVPRQYVPGMAAPFIVGADGPDKLLFTALDNLIAQKKVPVMIAISIGNGGGDAQGSQRGLEYDTMSGKYAEFVETEVLPLVEKQCNVKLTKDPEGRATMGCSSGGSCALAMAWYRPDLYHRVLTYSGTYVNQQWPHNTETPHGAWEFHEHLIPDSPAKPLRIWLEVSDRDLLNPNAMLDGMHDWVLANENMAKALADKGYTYQFVFARNAVHCDASVKQQTLPVALQWLWKGYPLSGAR